jgi:hypothetical protein
MKAEKNRPIASDKVKDDLRKARVFVKTPFSGIARTLDCANPPHVGGDCEAGTQQMVAAVDRCGRLTARRVPAREAVSVDWRCKGATRVVDRLAERLKGTAGTLTRSRVGLTSVALSQLFADRTFQGSFHLRRYVASNFDLDVLWLPWNAMEPAWHPWGLGRPTWERNRRAREIAAKFREMPRGIGKVTPSITSRVEERINDKQEKRQNNENRHYGHNATYGLRGPRLRLL